METAGAHEWNKGWERRRLRWFWVRLKQQKNSSSVHSMPWKRLSAYKCDQSAPEGHRRYLNRHYRRRYSPLRYHPHNIVNKVVKHAWGFQTCMLLHAAPWIPALDLPHLLLTSLLQLLLAQILLQVPSQTPVVFITWRQAHVWASNILPAEPQHPAACICTVWPQGGSKSSGLCNSIRLEPKRNHPGCHSCWMTDQQKHKSGSWSHDISDSEQATSLTFFVHLTSILMSLISFRTVSLVCFVKQHTQNFQHPGQLYEDHLNFMAELMKPWGSDENWVTPAVVQQWRKEHFLHSFVVRLYHSNLQDVLSAVAAEYRTHSIHIVTVLAAEDP